MVDEKGFVCDIWLDFLREWSIIDIGFIGPCEARGSRPDIRAMSIGSMGYGSVRVSCFGGAWRREYVYCERSDRNESLFESSSGNRDRQRLGVIGGGEPVVV